MIKKRFILLLTALIYISAFTGCSASKIDDVTTNEPTTQVTPDPTPTEAIIIPSEKIVFVFVESKKDSLMAQYNLDAYQELADQGYNVSTMYVDESQDLTGIFTQLELDGAKYIFATDSSLKNSIEQYQDITSSTMVFAISENYWPVEEGLSYAIKLYEYYYFAGVALGSKSETSVAGFLADEADAQTIRCINAFALGMKSVNQDATVLINWTQNSSDESAISQSIENLIYQNCDVFAYKQDGNLVETVCENLGVYYMSPYATSSIDENKSLVLTPTIDLSGYINSVLSQDITSSQFKYLGVKEDVITFNVSKEILSDETIDLLYSITQSIRSTSYEVFTGPIYNEYGMVVDEGVALPETDIISMLWFVNNVVGDIPAG